MPPRAQKTTAKAKAKPLSKAQIVSELAEKTQLPKSQVAALFDALDSLIAENLKTPGVFTIPNIAKITVVRKKATPARPGRNPFTGAEITIKAKPAHNVVRVRPLKHLKDMA